MFERPFYITVLDGEDPGTWIPYKSKGAALTDICERIRTRAADIKIPKPTRLRVELSLVPNSRIFEEQYANVYGIIVDGRPFLESAASRDVVEKQLELLIGRIISQNSRLNYFGLGVFGILDEPYSQQPINDLYERLEKAISYARDMDIPVQPQVLPVYEALDGMMRNELAKFQSREPLAVARGH